MPGQPNSRLPTDDTAAAAAAAARARAEVIFRQHFEARFKPLEAPRDRVPTRAAERHDSDSQSEAGSSDGHDSESDWQGVSDHGESEDKLDGRAVEVVDHSSSHWNDGPVMDKRESKKFLSSKPPSSSSSSSGPRADTRTPARSNHDGGADGDDEDEDSAAFLAKDLALQRLISESHILAAAGGNAAYYTSATSGGAAASAPAEKLFSGGRVRRLTTDLRLQALGAKGSVLKQAKMPMNVRKGLEAAAAERENKRRREARENGVVLERRGGGGSAIVGAGGVGGAAARGKGKGKRRGSRPVDLPAVGKLRGAELRISARDIRSVENLGRSPAGKGRHKRRR